MPRGRRGALAAASALAVVAGSACGAPVDITELRVAAATRAEPTTSAQAIPQRLPLDGLIATGFDACSTASNHTLDQGAAGLTRTLDEFDAAGLVHDGSYRTSEDAATPTVTTTSTGRVGLTSATYGLNSGEPGEPWMVTPLDPEAIVAKAERAKAAGADIVIVAIHAGTEYQTEPDSDQVEAATALLASPAIDLVYGHHAHVVQQIDRINGKWAIYGLSNMIAAQDTNRPDSRGFVGPGDLQPRGCRQLEHQRYCLGAVTATGCQPVHLMRARYQPSLHFRRRRSDGIGPDHRGGQSVGRGWGWRAPADQPLSCSPA